MFLFHGSREDIAGFGWAKTIHLTDNLADAYKFQRYWLKHHARRNPGKRHEIFITVYAFEISDNMLRKYVPEGRQYDGHYERDRLESAVLRQGVIARYDYDVEIPRAYCAPVDLVGSPHSFQHAVMTAVPHTDRTVEVYRRLHSGLHPIDDFYIIENRGESMDWREDFEAQRVENSRKRDDVVRRLPYDLIKNIKT